MSRICSHCGYENMDDSLVRCDVCGEPLMPVYSSNQSGPSGGNNQQGVGFFITDKRVWSDKVSAVCAVLIAAAIIYFAWNYFLQEWISYYFF